MNIMLKHILISLVVCSCFLSCAEKESTFTGREIKIDLSKLKKNINIDLSTLNCEYIDLETVDGSLIGNIDKIYYVNDKIYVLDKEIAGAIFIFDNKGKFISKIDAKGQGPGEYAEIDDFLVDMQTQEILILDYDQSKIIYYLGNKFKNEVKITEDFENFTQIKNHIIGINNYCYNKDGCYKISIFNKNLKLKKQIMPTPNNADNVSWDLKRTIHKYNDSLFLTEPFTNYIYAIDKNFNVSPCYYINFGKDSLDVNKNEMKRDKFLNYIDNTNKAFLVDNFLEMGNIISFNFFYNKKQVFCFSHSDGSKTLCANSIVDVKKKVVMMPIHADEKYMFFKMIKLGDIDSNATYQANPTILKVLISEIDKIIPF